MARSDTLQVDGHPMRVYLDAPAGGGTRPGVVVMIHGPGLDKFIETQVEDLARHGYIAAAPDLFHRQAAGGDMRTRGSARSPCSASAWAAATAIFWPGLGPRTGRQRASSMAATS